METVVNCLSVAAQIPLDNILGHFSFLAHNCIVFAFIFTKSWTGYINDYDSFRINCHIYGLLI